MMTQMQKLCRMAAAEGAVLLKNEKNTLPIREGETVSIFGRIQLNYYKSGTGSGGLVNVNYVVDIPDGLRHAGGITVNEELYNTYAAWENDHPFDSGSGWAQEPFCQEEMPVSDELAEKAAGQSDLALVVLGRLAGEDRDSEAEKGSYYLSDGEMDLLRTVRAHFDRVAVVLNVGNQMDMNWDDLCDAVLYVWQGGQEGGNGVADVLTGRVTPSGKLSDTIARDLARVPAMKNFGNEDNDDYQEDIYVGYRWFETFDPENVKYPFGFGLSYTTFSLGETTAREEDGRFVFSTPVTNTGAVPGKEVVQVYVRAPQGRLGQPARVLCGFAKTGLLQPGDTETVVIPVQKETLASYDDSGVTGYKSCRVLEAGEYGFYVGCDVRSAGKAASFTLPETLVTEQLHEALSPTFPMMRLHPMAENGILKPRMEPVPMRTYDLARRIEENRPADIAYTGDRGITLQDVRDGKNTLSQLIAQMTDEDLCCIVRGEGMCSPKVTPGTASAFGGLTPHLRALGLPAGCCADGPSGIRMDCGTRATSLPSGTLLACTFNEALNEALFTEMGKELYKNRIDTLLGPGINIHRCPLNGRNFEYFSEDPLLTGRMACAQLRGMHHAPVTGTIKHFCANNQEHRRTFISSNISERALRDIYLRGFEIAVKEGSAHSIMTTYGAVNHIWTAGNYDLCTTILRREWGFTGIVMTDWWAKMNDENEEAIQQNTKAMVRAQNDLYMVVADSLTNSAHDNTAEALANGQLTRGELQRCAANICRFLMNSQCMEEREDDDETGTDPETGEKTAKIDFIIRDGAVLDTRGIDTTRGTNTIYNTYVEKGGTYKVTATASSEASEVAQIPVTLSLRHHMTMFAFVGSDGKVVEKEATITLDRGTEYMKLYFGLSGLSLIQLRFEQID